MMDRTEQRESAKVYTESQDSTLAEKGIIRTELGSVLRIAFSYIRFSSSHQARGDSLRRQLDGTVKFCREHNLVLDESLSFRDLGVSAFKGKHRKEGALGHFLEAVKDGRVSSGSVLIVESLDRLSREQPSIAFQIFLQIVNAGVEIVTLIDKQWYSQANLAKDCGSLFISLGSMIRAFDDSRTRAERSGMNWSQKRKHARQNCTPMTRICPGWLTLSEKGDSYVSISDRVKKVKLIYWLTLRGWGKRRIVDLFNRCRYEPWGIGGKKAKGWHESYIQKILTNRAVLGEYLPHTTREEQRKPIGDVVKNYYKAIIDEGIFYRVQGRGRRPAGPSGKRVSNLFQGLLFDGEHPEYTMRFTNKGTAKRGSGRWMYVYSDYRRAHPETPRFSWNYHELESLLLNFIKDLDWSNLVWDRTAEIRKLSDTLACSEAKLHELEGQIQTLVALAERAGKVEEVSKRLLQTDQDRNELRSQIASLKSALHAKGGFSLEDQARLLRELAADGASANERMKLRDEIRRQVKRIELFPDLPTSLRAIELPSVKDFPGIDLRSLMRGRCARIFFRMGSERWVIDPTGLSKTVTAVDRMQVGSTMEQTVVTSQMPMNMAVGLAKFHDGTTVVAMRQRQSPPFETV